MGKTLPTERPILFSAPMVRALLEGRKTQTRRICKDAMVDHFGEAWPASSTTFDGKEWVARWPEKLQGKTVSDGYKSPQEDRIRCPFGLPIERLWVRETWRRDDYDPAGVIYAADAPADALAETRGIIKWRPSIFMPRDASRITLEIASVRAERLQDISEADAKAEGCTARTYRDGRGHEPAVVDFRDLWGKINGVGAWNANPWVWVVEFKRVQP